MNLRHKPTKVLVAGRSGSGKSTFATRYLLNADARLRFVFDHQGEFAEKAGITPATDPRALAAHLASGWVVYDPSEMFPGDLEAAWCFFCDFVFEVSQGTPGRKLLFADELQMLMSRGSIPKEFARVLETGRRYELDLILVAQQLNLLNNRIRFQLTEVVAFSQGDRTAIEWLSDSGFDSEEIRNLPPLHYVDRQVSTGDESRGVVTF